MSSRGAALRILLFYLVLGAVTAGLLWYLPAFRDLVSFEALPMAQVNGAISGTFGQFTPTQGAIPTGWESVWVTALSLVGALVIMIPVTWTYVLIKRDAGYQESVVHTLLILPVAVAGIVTIVQGSLALAFSLAGIVAAVRFRTTLDDTKDAVYVFLAIGVGLAAGVQALGVALALSVVFNLVNLILWKLNFGNIFADQLQWTGGLGLGTVIAGPTSSRSAVGFGDLRAGEGLAPGSLAEVELHQAKIREQLHGESSGAKERKRFSALLVYTTDVEGVKELLEGMLEGMTVRARLADIVEGEGEGVSALTWLVRLRDGVAEVEFIRAIREADTGSLIRAAELRSLRTMAGDG